jgi:phosphoglycolate phosphatase
MPHRFKAILFDLDGTLIDSAYDLHATMNVVLREEGRRTIDLQDMKAATGDGLRVMLDKAWNLTGEPLTEAARDRLMPRFLEIYAATIPQLSCIFPGTLPFLEQQKRQGVKMAVCTNKHERISKHILKHLGLEPYFGACIGGDTLAERKPHPLPLQHALKILNVAPEDAVMIGDSPNDLWAATAAGLPCVMAEYGYTAGWPKDLVAAANLKTMESCEIVLEKISAAS